MLKIMVRCVVHDLLAGPALPQNPVHPRIRCPFYVQYAHPLSSCISRRIRDMLRPAGAGKGKGVWTGAPLTRPGGRCAG